MTVDLKANRSKNRSPTHLCSRQEGCFHAEPRAKFLLVSFRCRRIRLISATTNCIVNRVTAAKSKFRFIHQQLSAGTSKPFAQVKSHAPTKCSRCNEKNRPIPGRRKKLLTKKSGSTKLKTAG